MFWTSRYIKDKFRSKIAHVPLLYTRHLQYREAMGSLIGNITGYTDDSENDGDVLCHFARTMYPKMGD